MSTRDMARGDEGPTGPRIGRRLLLQRAVGATASLALAALVAACGGSAPATGTTAPAPSGTTGGGARPTARTVSGDGQGQPKKGGTLRVGFLEPTSLDPHSHSSTATGNIVGFIYDSLMIQDPFTGEYIAGPLSESVTVSPDQKTWTFKLKQGITFHDGTPFNASVMKTNHERAVDPQAKTAVTGIYLPPKATFSAPDANTYVITSPDPYGPMASHVFWDSFFGVYSPPAREKWGADFGRHPVGAGPFKFKEWVAGDHITLERNEQYTWGSTFLKNKGPAYLDSIFIKIIAEQSTLVAALQSGEIDVAYLPNAFYADFSKNQNFQILTRPSGALTALGWNLDRWPFTDLKTRQALMYGFDRQRFLQVMEEGHGKPMYGSIVPALPYYWAGEDTEGPKFDLAKAKSLLAAAGWADGDKDGIIEKDGKPFRVTMVAGGTEENVRWSSLAKAQAKELGIDVQVETLETAALTARLNSANYDLFRFGYDTVDPDILAFFFYASQIPKDGGAGLNRSRVNDPKLEELLGKQRSTLGEDRRKAVEACVRYMMEQAIFLPLYSPEKHTVVAKKVKGVIFYPDAADWELTEAWIDQ